jgi:hypothetical protein
MALTDRWLTKKRDALTRQLNHLPGPFANWTERERLISDTMVATLAAVNAELEGRSSSHDDRLPP